MSRKLRTLIAASILIVCGNASALPITVDPGESVLLNIDLTGLSSFPLQPADVATVFATSTTQADVSTVFTAFNELNGVDEFFSAPFFVTDLGLALSADLNPNFLADDGLASIRLENADATGSFTINGAEATFSQTFFDPVPFTPILVPEDDPGREVPAPATLALLGLGLLGIARRRKA